MFASLGSVRLSVALATIVQWPMVGCGPLHPWLTHSNRTTTTTTSALGGKNNGLQRELILLSLSLSSACWLTDCVHTHTHTGRVCVKKRQAGSLPSVCLLSSHFCIVSRSPVSAVEQRRRRRRRRRHTSK